MGKRSAASGALAIVAVLALAGTALGAAFDNGSFDSGSYSDDSGGFMADVTGSGTISNWTVTGAIDWNGLYWDNQDGPHSIDMNATPTQGTLTQELATGPNNTYVMTFYQSGNPNCGLGTKSLTVQAASAAPQTFNYVLTAANSNSNMLWVQQTYTFVGTGSSATLSIASASTGACGAAIDNIVITQTVATGANCKRDGWRTMVDTFGTAFRNQGDCVSFYATGEKNLAF